MLSSLRAAVVLILSAGLFYAPLFALRGIGIASAQEKQLAAKASPRELAAHEPDTLLIKPRPEAAAQMQSLLSAFALEYQPLRGLSGVVKLRLNAGRDFDAVLDALSQLDAAVEWVEPNYLVKRASAKAASLRPVAKAAAFRNATKSNRAVAAANSTIIAVIDSGVDLNHRELKPRLWSNDAEKAGKRLSRNGLDDDRNGFADDLHGWNFVADNGDVRDDLGHGTQVAGVIAQAAGLQRNSAIRLLPLKALDQSGTGTVADIVEAMDYAVARHVAVINCSFGTPGYSQALLDAVKRAQTAGIVVVAAAGNEAKDLSQSPFYPAAFSSAFSSSRSASQANNLISVAASEEHRPGEVRLAGYSNFNADIAAPGTVRTTHLNNGHVTLTGTSAAAGIVAGAAARLKNVRGWVSAQTVRDSLLKSAQESPRLLGALSKVSSRGSVNPQAALARFTRETSAGKAWQRGNGKPPELTPEIRAALRAGANLDRLRNDKPQRPDPGIQREWQRERQ